MCAVFFCAQFGACFADTHTQNLLCVAFRHHLLNSASLLPHTHTHTHSCIQIAILPPEVAVSSIAGSALVSVTSGTTRIPASALIAFLWAQLASPGESTVSFVSLIFMRLINCHGNRRGFWDSRTIGPFIIGQN